MNDLRVKMEAELNAISLKMGNVLADVTISDDSKFSLLRELERKRDALRQLLQSYISIQNRFTELMNGFAVAY